MTYDGIEFKPVTIDGKTAKAFYDTIRAAGDAYGDESRYDWFDVDDTLINLAWELEHIIEQAQR